MPLDPELTRRLVRFAEVGEADSPLYGKFARAASRDELCHRILGHAPPSQPAANVLLAAVQYLLLQGEDDHLAAHYPALNRDGRPAEGDPVELFLRFCADREQELSALAATGKVQTNEVRRCTFLVPAFRAAVGDRPMALIEIGPSAGLNMCFDRYRYDYGTARTGPEGSPLTLTTEVRRGTPPVEGPLPEVAWRAGVDLNPIDLDDHDQVRWARALLWPEAIERVHRFETAVSLVRRDPPRIVAGDALEVLPRLIEEAPGDVALVVLHSFVLNQFTEGGRREFDQILRSASQGRTIHRIGVEGLIKTRDWPDVVLTHYDAGDAESRSLGTAHYHGAWLEWNE